ncbi:RagB/SusD family nutrient uptake outer membrane protein [Capnocytophaga canimorsus]|uniref:RagB/SusD family nutrient uptake outer membrane protein n=1 Tax=Capnocytophaga canimorsus TaxID=28188 RepID=UPI000F500507|nr:RagB/SusD family nutrient uptake outer membrane protein [Capnocytophaga canimorsus]AYW36975.1 RagB/SusD family nutrient uptake outer membrane protein [Capnocytophaga canimorsus]
MKTIKKIALILSIALVFNACQFLDIVPDEIATEKDAFKNQRTTEGFLYSCYSYLPQPNHGTASLDFMTGDEVVTAFEHETFANFPKGNFTASSPSISYWNTLFQGIRQCYILKNNIDGVYDINPDTKNDYVAQADFLIAYYHFLLLRSYGPIILVKTEPNLNTPASDFLSRSPYDECVDWIAAKFDEVIPRLPKKREGEQYGLATSIAAKAIKARMLLYAASPLFNGNADFYANFTDKDGNPMMNNSFSLGKWERAKVACKEAIDDAEASGYRLYVGTDAAYSDTPEPKDLTQRGLRFSTIDKANSEVIWAETRHEGAYALQNKSRPYWGGTWNGVAPTLTMLERFYTEKGLPIDVDPDFDYANRYGIVSFDATDNLVKGEGETLLFNMKREPRFYAWVAFHGGYYECRGNAVANTQNTNQNLPYLPKYKRGDGNAKLVTFFTRNDNCGKRDRSNDFSPTGFLNKKGVHPANTADGNINYPKNVPWPIVRLGELYLNYAEACVETGDIAEAKLYTNKVRVRAGIPTLDESWGSIGVSLDQAKLREVVRQERMIELYLENHNFWDIRRWKLAEKYFGTKVRGMNVNGADLPSFAKEVEVGVVRNFNSPAHYLMPIPIGEINKNAKLVQNPGY